MHSTRQRFSLLSIVAAMCLTNIVGDSLLFGSSLTHRLEMGLHDWCLAGHPLELDTVHDHLPRVTDGPILVDEMRAFRRSYLKPLPQTDRTKQSKLHRFLVLH